ncbi:family 43 glycosylhydrolase [Arthrobacter sp. UC242_113]|uniref:family 43 glycosylhydrolase n=1 Tax=Arthrobacter sp. UC242_113 TaxID=3374550 RepID=UPI00375707E8
MYWAPEVHKYRDHWFMFATFTAPNGYRGTVLRADDPAGLFTPWSEGATTPRKWQCLDGTLFVDHHEQPWIVLCHEWTQIRDGAVYAQRLSDDPSRPTGQPVFIFNASDAAWSRPMQGAPFDDYKFPVHVTDGPFLFRLQSRRKARCPPMAATA